MHGNDSLEFRLNNMAFNQDICACMWVYDERRFKLKQALWRWFSEDFVCMNGAGLCTPPRFCTAWPLAWPLEDNLQQHQLPCALPRITFPHYFFNVTFAVRQKMAGFNRRVRGQEEEGKDAGQIGSTVVFGQCPQRIHSHEASWTLSPAAVCQKMTHSVDWFGD